MPLRIGIIAHVKHSICEPFAGGLEAHTAHLARALIENGHSVTLFSAGDEVASGHVEYFCRQTVDFAALGDGGFEYEHHAYHDLMQTIAERDFDIIHNNSLHYLPIAMAGQLPFPMVTTLHTPPFWEMAGSIQLSQHENSFFVAVSESIRKSWSSVMEVDCTIPNGVDLEKFRFVPVLSGAPYLFWFGRIVPEKGLHLAIEAARLARIPLLFAGPVSDPAYFEAAIRPTLGNQTQYLGHLNHERLTALMGGARACVCTPMWEEPYGLVVAEALACGTPVAGFARGALPDLVDGKSGILVEPDDVEALASAMHAVQALSRYDCRNQAERICDAARMIRAYESIYYSLCGTVVPFSSQPNQPAWYSELLSRESLNSYYQRNVSIGFLEDTATT
jgi:glycosyltransferase involved in cell wall biosynthesis